jgi:hypothetical protein
MSTQEERFCRELAESFPDVNTILNEHVDYYEELLPNVFMGDLTRYILGDGPERADIVQHLEDAFVSGTRDLEDLIAVSFVENIETRDSLEHALNGVKGNGLRGEWERQNAG